MRSALVGAALLLAAGCSPDAREPDASGTADRLPTASGQSGKGSGPAAAAAPATPGVTPPPAGAEHRFVGQWASRTDLCEGGAWVFQSDRFGMEDGPICDFTEVTEIPRGYRIEAQCEAPRDAASHSTFTVQFAQSGRAISVKGLASLPETDLVYCGPA